MANDPNCPSPRQILETLLPYLRTAGAYAKQIQSKIQAQPAKDGKGDNFFASALSDADLSIQTMVEVALLAHFPQVRFYGEEYEQTYNTKYFRAIDMGSANDYLITLDPIDGTQFYLDGHNNYQIILGVLNTDEYEAVLAITPGQGLYYYTLRGEGTFKGHLHQPLEDCIRVDIASPAAAICLGWQMGEVVPYIPDHYTIYHTKTAYSQETQIPNFNGLLNGDLTGAILARGQFIDGAALAFMAQEMGYVVTTLTGEPLPLLCECRSYHRPGMIVASSQKVYQDLRQALIAAEQTSSNVYPHL
jgi:myo-inositol-1(or 4)-monophosphatase